MFAVLNRLRPFPQRQSEISESFRVVAIMSVRDDEVYLERCLQSMREQGVEACVINNDANAATRRILDKYRGGGVFHIERYPHPGYFDWEGILGKKLELVRQIETDWFMLWDTDEIREPELPFANLREAFHAVDQAGYNSVNFDEFVFLPVSDDESYVGRDYVADMKNYYWFRPQANQRLTAWKNLTTAVDVSSSAGHQVYFANQTIFPKSFVLRHYLFLSRQHGLRKYCQRTYSPLELAKGWSLTRSLLTEENFTLPSLDFMQHYAGDRVWRRDDPKTHHPCFPSPPMSEPAKAA